MGDIFGVPGQEPVSARNKNIQAKRMLSKAFELCGGSKRYKRLHAAPIRSHTQSTSTKTEEGKMMAAEIPTQQNGRPKASRRLILCFDGSLAYLRCC